MGKTYKVISDWFRRTDSLNHKFSTWCKALNDKEVLCIICNKTIYCGSKGFGALSQHVLSNVHKDNTELKLNCKQLSFAIKPIQNSASNVSESASGCTQTNQVSLFSNKESVTRAEVVWALKSVQCNMAANACDDLKHIFKAMFSGSEVSENFRLGRTKLTYLITEALGPYFRKELLDDAKNSYYSLLFDETVNYADKKELQFKIKYWSPKANEIVCKHLQTVFLGHVTAEDLVSQIQSVLNNACLSTNNLLMLGSDGPYVNKKVWRLLNTFLLEERGHGLLDIGTCNLHVIHNAFVKGLQEYGDSASELITDLYYYFKKFPSRWEDFENCQSKKNVPHHRFLKHVNSRWLTIGPAAERVLEQWAAIEHYFFIFVSVQDKKLSQTTKFKQIVKSLKFLDIKAELSFIIDSCGIYSRFLELFQRSDPLIHVLNEELQIILNKLAGRICKPNVINVENIIVAEHLLGKTEIDVGEKTKVQLELLSEIDRLPVLHKIQKHYMSSYNYIVNKNVMQRDNITFYFQCLNYDKISNPKSVHYISQVAKFLSLTGVTDLAVKDEWRLLQTQVNFFEKSNRIDHFWREIFSQRTDSGFLMYPSLSKLVKASLSLSHGNSDVERGFSLSRRVLSEDKTSMSERVLNDRLIIRDALQNYANAAEVPLTKDLLNRAYAARKSYELYLEEEKKLKEKKLKEEKEIEERNKLLKLEEEKAINLKVSVQKIEEKAKLALQEKKDVQESADTLFKDANEKLKAAIKNKDLEGIRVAQGMMEGTLKLRKKEREHEMKEEKLNRIMNKRKSNLIETFCIKKTKP